MKPFLNPATLSWELLFDSRVGIAAADNASFFAWADQSGNGRNAGHVGACFPRYRAANNVGGLDSPTHQPLTDWNVNPACPGAVLTGGLPVVPIDTTNGFTVLAWYMLDVVRTPDALGTAIQNMFFSPTSGGWVLNPEMQQVPPIGTDPDFGFSVGNPAVRIHGGTGLVTTGVNTLFGVCTPPAASGAMKLWRNGTLVASTTGWNCGPNTDFNIGGGGAGGNFAGRIGYLAMGSFAVTDGQRIGINNYLRSVFGSY